MAMERTLCMLCTEEAEHTTHGRSNERPPHPSPQAAWPGK
jgi:hypothetical protein